MLYEVITSQFESLGFIPADQNSGDCGNWTADKTYDKSNFNLWIYELKYLGIWHGTHSDSAYYNGGCLYTDITSGLEGYYDKVDAIETSYNFV